MIWTSVAQSGALEVVESRGEESSVDSLEYSIQAARCSFTVFGYGLKLCTMDYDGYIGA